MYTNQLTNGVHFLFLTILQAEAAALRKTCSSASKTSPFSKIFAQICSRFVVFYRGFSKFYKLAFLRKPFSSGCWPLQGSQNIDFHKSCSIYIHGHRLRSGET